MPVTAYWVVLISYIIGLLPSAYIAGRLQKGIDIRKIGDRNAGAANVYRNISHTAGTAVLVADIGKGALAILLAQAVASQPIVLLCGVAVVAGHNWPLFHGFRGGPGTGNHYRRPARLTNGADGHPLCRWHHIALEKT